MGQPTKPDNQVAQFYGSSEFQSFPSLREWFWNLSTLSSEALRTACFIEFARENEYLLAQIGKIERNLDKLKFGTGQKRINKLRGIVQEIHETGLFHDLFVVDPEDADTGARLVRQVQKLARDIHPLPPHFLVGRAVTTEPFIAGPTDEPARVYRGLSLPSPRSQKPKRDDAMPDAIDRPGAGYSEDVWLALVKGGYRDGGIEVKSYRHFNGGKANPPAELMTSRTGRRLLRRDCHATLISMQILESGDYGALIRAAFGTFEPIPTVLKGKAFRLKAEVAKGAPLVSITEDYDGFKDCDSQDDFLFIAARGSMDVYRGLRANLAQILKSRRDVKESILSGNSGSTDGFCIKALRALSSVRMACSISREQYDEMVNLHKSKHDSLRQKLLIPLIDHRTATDQMEQYEDCASKIFPNLEEGERKSRTRQLKEWTMLHYKFGRKGGEVTHQTPGLSKANPWGKSALLEVQTPDVITRVKKPPQKRRRRKKPEDTD